eukprot:TRINITY_DN4137_c0_g1_i1.p1 TRINITY_DN4137_c0_g1~~TRINITY_DN4137_c0_g1_i1.p1  ORF type:complete len:433 (-),score=148.19 TRINITY_DN4137_c0_g1_i1:297-1541(-)
MAPPAAKRHVRARRSALPATLVVAATAAATLACSAWRSAGRGFASPNLRATTSDLEAAEAGLRRREVAAGLAVASGLSTVFGASPALAEEVAAATATAKVTQIANTADARMQRLLINIEDDEAMASEIKFWKDALGMQILSDGKVADGNREVIMSYGSEKAGAFAVQVRIDPALAARQKPKFLNFDVLQPTVDALNFVQVSQPNKVIDVFEKVQAAGGSAMIGDYQYFDVTSPRGVPVRIVSKADKAPTVDHVCLNIEVPAFEATNKFYQRAFGFKELSYPAEEPPVQQLSRFYESKSGGPKLLLSPVPDKRMKDRALDEFEGLLLTSSSTPQLIAQAENAVALARQEQDEKKKEEELLMGAKGKIKSKDKNPETVAVPDVTKAASAAGLTTVDDGLGNFLFVTAKDEFEKRVA